jgi:hypothetical protein
VPRVDYFGIAQAARAVLQADEELADASIVAEEVPEPFGSETTPRVAIYVESRSAPANLQRISSGRSTVYVIQVRIVCMTHSLESVARVIQLRDDLIGRVETALMRQRTLNGTVRTLYLEGGRLASAEALEANGWTSSGEVRVLAEAEATTT